MKMKQGYISSLPKLNEVGYWTDKYFTLTKGIVDNFGDNLVTYAIFMRVPVLCALSPVFDWLYGVAKEGNFEINIDTKFKESDLVGGGDVLFYLTGSMSKLVELETILLQKVGFVCCVAYDAYKLAMTMPQTYFIAMDGRHCAGLEMSEFASYGVAVGSAKAKLEGAKGYLGSSNEVGSEYFDMAALGTMPHCLIGYAGSTLKAAQYFDDTYPDKHITVLIDYFGKEVSDALEVCNYFREKALKGEISLRIDTHGARYLEGLNPQKSYDIIDKYAKNAIRSKRTPKELSILIGTGVSAAAIFHLREKLDEAGFNNVRIVASSGFGFTKCQIMAEVGAPIDVVGTGSYLPNDWRNTYATADIIEYNGVPSVKVGREFLYRR